MSHSFTGLRMLGLAGAVVVAVSVPNDVSAQQQRAAPTVGVQQPQRSPEQPASPSTNAPQRNNNAELPVSPRAVTASDKAASSEFGKIEERIKAIVESIQQSATNLDNALTELDGGSSGDSVRKIDSRIGDIMTTAQAALDIAGNSGLLADRLAKLKAVVEADEGRIESLGQTDDQKRAMRERIAKQRGDLEAQTKSLAQARQKALEKINETVQLRPVIAWYARRDKVEEVTERLKPLVKSVNELASSLDTLVKSTLQDPAKVPN
jgi:hypothetical protein